MNFLQIGESNIVISKDDINHAECINLVVEKCGLRYFAEIWKNETVNVQVSKGYEHPGDWMAEDLPREILDTDPKSTMFDGVKLLMEYVDPDRFISMTVY